MPFGWHGRSASVIAVDIDSVVSTDNGYPPATADDLQETARLVEGEGRQILARTTDVRDSAGLEATSQRASSGSVVGLTSWLRMLVSATGIGSGRCRKNNGRL
jgi:hypothetical protein